MCGVVLAEPFGSEESLVFGTLDGVIIGSHGLEDVVRVGGVASEAFLLGAGLALVNDLSAHANVLLHHLDHEDVVDFDVMG